MEKTYGQRTVSTLVEHAFNTVNKTIAFMVTLKVFHQLI